MSLIDDVLSNYYRALINTNKSQALSIIRGALDQGVDAQELLFSVVIPSVNLMINEFLVEETTTLSQHYICSKAASEATDILLADFGQGQKTAGTIILGTARGDFHGLGKKIVGGCLKANLISVIDLGVNVTAEHFIEQAVEHEASVIGISSMMVHTAAGELGARKVRSLLKEKKLDSKISLIVGGAPYRFDPELYEQVGADAWAENALDSITLIQQLL